MNAHSKFAPSEPLEADAVPYPVDHAHLARFTQGNGALEREVLQLFAEHLPVTLAQLRAAAGSRDWEMAAHSLKGSARAVGAWRLERLAEEAERMGGSGAPEGRLALLVQIEAAAEEARTYIGRYCSRHGPRGP